MSATKISLEIWGKLIPRCDKKILEGNAPYLEKYLSQDQVDFIINHPDTFFEDEQIKKVIRKYNLFAKDFKECEDTEWRKSALCDYIRWVLTQGSVGKKEEVKPKDVQKKKKSIKTDADLDKKEIESNFISTPIVIEKKDSKKSTKDLTVKKPKVETVDPAENEVVGVPDDTKEGASTKKITSDFAKEVEDVNFEGNNAKFFGQCVREKVKVEEKAIGQSGKCPDCGFDNGITNFCAKCGKPLGNTKTTTTFNSELVLLACSNVDRCSQALQLKKVSDEHFDDFNFCKECGAGILEFWVKPKGEKKRWDWKTLKKSIIDFFTDNK